MDNSTILVPLKLEAIMIDDRSAKDGHWKDLGVYYDTIWDRVSEDMEDGIFSEQPKFLKAGIHLHWALPAALRHGIYNGKEMEFTPVPNRWLVMRKQNVKGRLVHKEWIIESDYVNPDASNSWISKDGSGYVNDTRIGRSMEYNDWTSESNIPSDPLTALGPGNALFSAFYGGCRDVFGFHDPMENLSEGTFSYLVTGWYSTSELDPLHPGGTEISRKRTSDIQNKWKLSRELGKYPETSLCHCFIHSLSWKRSGNYSNDILKASVNLAVGNTSIEAMSARMARQTGAAEKLLSAYQYDLLKDVSGLVEVQDQIHARQFTGTTGGILWEIRRSEDKDPARKENKQELSHFPDTNDPRLTGLADNFSNLNKKQRKMDSLRRTLHSLQLEFRSAWDKMILDELDKSAHQTFLLNKRKNLVAKINKVNKSIDAVSGKINTLRSSIQNLQPFKKTNEKPPEFELVEMQMPRFWQPNDPSCLLSGPGVKSFDKYKTPDNNQNGQKQGALNCRLPDEIISGIRLKDTKLDELSVKIEVPFPLTGKNSLVKVFDHVAKIFQESLIVDPAWALDLAFGYYNKKKNNVTRKSPFVTDLSNIILKYLNTNQYGRTSQDYIKGLRKENGKSMDPPGSKMEKLQLFNAFATYKWSKPWTPLFLLWNIEWYPAYTYNKRQKKWNYNPGNWSFTNGYDYDQSKRFKGPKPGNRNYIAGKTILSDAASTHLKKRLQDFPRLSDLQFLSQALDGFNDALHMRNRAIQLPLLEYDKDDNLSIVEKFNSYLSSGQYLLPDPSKSFFPIRAGHIKINRLWVADTFGQIQKIVDVNDHVISSTGLQEMAEDLDSKSGDYITLPPRIVQPSRLLFRWVAADESKGEQETDSNPDTTPVCGWIMPNHLDHSLMVFKASGEIVGRLAADLTGTLKWYGVAGKNGPPNLNRDIGDKELKGFINGLLQVRSQKNTLNRLLKFIDKVSDTIDSAGARQDPGMAVLVGQPLALVRASIKLELQGLPVYPQGWRAGWTTKTAKQPIGLNGVEFPVILGDMRKYKDGLIGYFRQSDYTRMYPCFASAPVPDEYFSSQALSLSFTANNDPYFITLLMDPRAGVNASSGILPTKYIDIPSHFVKRAMEAMEMNFLVAPVIGRVDSPAIPLARDASKEWAWVYRNKSGTWSEPDTGIADRSQLAKNDFLPQQIHEGYLSLKVKKE